MEKKPKDVGGYIASAPKEARAKLAQLRRIIRAAAPGAEEKISYGMPYYGYHGRLAYFRLATRHIGLYIPPPIIAKHKKELKGYGTSISAVRFPLDELLPVTLIGKLVRERAEWNERKAGKSPGGIRMSPGKGNSPVCSRGHKFHKSKTCPVCPVCYPGYYKKK